VTVRDEPTHVVLEVHNEGTPIPAAVLPQLFEPFRRATGAGAIAARSNGLGLGLYIARQIVLAHRGTLEVHSQEGDGTTFTVRLPRRAPRRGAHLTA
jgi:signal transduction histidine kinase